jgi:hypothetical protein
VEEALLFESVGDIVMIVVVDAEVILITAVTGILEVIGVRVAQSNVRVKNNEIQANETDIPITQKFRRPNMDLNSNFFRMPILTTLDR